VQDFVDLTRLAWILLIVHDTTSSWFWLVRMERVCVYVCMRTCVLWCVAGRSVYVHKVMDDASSYIQTANMFLRIHPHVTTCAQRCLASWLSPSPEKQRNSGYRVLEARYWQVVGWCKSPHTWR